MRKIILCLIIVSALPFTACAGEVTVAAAANLQNTVEDLKAAFKIEKGIDVKVITGASGQLTNQIENGAPFDVFMSADTDFPKRLAKDGLVIEGPRVYARGTLVLWTMRDDLDLSKGVALVGEGNVHRVAIATPKTAPYGRQAVNAMKKNNLYPAIDSKLVYGESISQVNQFISTKAVDIGFTAKSVVMADNMKDKGKWVEVSTEDYEPIAQAVVVLTHASKAKDTAREQDARAFYDFLFTQKAQDIFKKYGYVLP